MLPNSILLFLPVSNNELGELVSAINAMREGLKLSRDELQESHDYLEKNIESRTQELLLAKGAAEKANRAKPKFLATMNH
jgi:hypothetical protein